MSSRFTLRANSATTHKEAREVRARAWAFIFECWRVKQEDRSATDPDDANVTREGRRST
jgi:hypothetical protein